MIMIYGTYMTIVTVGFIDILLLDYFIMESLIFFFKKFHVAGMVAISNQFCFNLNNLDSFKYHITWLMKLH